MSHDRGLVSTGATEEGLADADRRARTSRDNVTSSPLMAFLAEESYRIAREHGWWDKPEDRNIPSKLMLTVSELAEALEDHRNGHMELYYSHKPFEEGDIRAAGQHILRNLTIEKSPGMAPRAVYYRGTSMEATYALETNDDWAAHGYDSKPEGFGIELADAIIRIFDLCGYLGIDITEMVRIKQRYNEFRPYRHGGKAV